MRFPRYKLQVRGLAHGSSQLAPAGGDLYGYELSRAVPKTREERAQLLVTCDPSIRPVLRALWDNGVDTIWSCSGFHYDPTSLEASYQGGTLLFNNDTDADAFAQSAQRIAPAWLRISRNGPDVYIEPTTNDFKTSEVNRFYAKLGRYIDSKWAVQK